MVRSRATPRDPAPHRPGHRPGQGPGHEPSRAERQRWATASELLRLVHAEPGITRTQAIDRLALSSGAATDLVDRLRNAGLLAEERAETSGPGRRGRPTTVLTAHPRGPLTIVVDLRSATWHVLLGNLGGHVTPVADGDYGDQEPVAFLPRIAQAVSRAEQQAAGRARVVVAAVAGTVSGTRLLQFATRGWAAADLTALTSKLATPIPLLAGNDATLDGLAEARTGAARGARVALHLLVAVGVGGTLLVDGTPAAGPRGAGGEYGHLPLGDPALRCPCGARGCWDLMVDGRALARHRGDPAPVDPVTYARDLLAGLSPDERAHTRDRHAADLTAHAFGAGIAGLVNLHDPDVITLGGIAPALRRAAPRAFDDAYISGLMTFHRQAPPPVLDGAHHNLGTTLGALSLGFEEITNPRGLSQWEADTRTRHTPPTR